MRTKTLRNYRCVNLLRKGVYFAECVNDGNCRCYPNADARTNSQPACLKHAGTVLQADFAELYDMIQQIDISTIDPNSPELLLQRKC